jgi:PAS domain S-box-containing protein
MLSLLLNACRDAVVVYDAEFRFVYINAEAERLMGGPRDAFIGKALWDVFADRAAQFREPLGRAMESRTAVTFELHNPANGRWTEGRCLPIEPSDMRAQDGDAPALHPSGATPALGVFFRDVTDRHEAARARDEAEAARERMAFLAEASVALSSSLDYHVTLERIAGTVVPTLCDWCAVQILREDGAAIEQVAVAHVDPARTAWAKEMQRRYPTNPNDRGGVAEVLRTGTPLFLPDISDEMLIAGTRDAEHLEMVRSIGFKSALAVPLTARGAVLGALLMVTEEKSGRRLTPDDVVFAQELARRAAIGVDNARLFRKARLEEERFRALIQASSQIVWRIGADGRIADAPEWREYTGQTEEELRDGAWWDAVHADDRARVEPGWRAAFAGRAIYDCDYRVRGRDGVYRWFFARGVPLFDEESGQLREYIGTCTNIDTERRASEERQELLLSTQRRAERVALLNRIGESIRQVREPDEILLAATRELGPAMGADRCYFAEYDVRRDWARVGADWHRPDLASLAGVYRLSELDLTVENLYTEPTGLILAADLTAPGPALSPKAASTLTGMGLRSVVGVALFEGGLPVAALVAAMAEAPRSWSDDETELIRTVAAMIRLAMDEARERKREHNIAERLQEALQPPLPGKVPGLDLHAFYQPALAEANVGGDFYDVFAIEKGWFALVVADLSGKGLAAATQVATVRHMLRTLLFHHGTTIASAVTTLNAMLADHDLLEGFATLFVGAYDVNQRTLTYASCGQEPGLLLRRDRGVVEELGTTGPVLGGFAGATFGERTVALARGDVLALFTDGLTEAGASRKDLVGVDGIVSIFRERAGDATVAADVAAQIFAGVEAAATPAGIRDDVCLLVACVE